MIKVILDGAKAKKGDCFSPSASGVLRGDIFRGLTLNSCKRLKLTTTIQVPNKLYVDSLFPSQMSIQIGLFGDLNQD